MKAAASQRAAFALPTYGTYFRYITDLDEADYR